jgi:hypothetical protein
MDSYLAEMPIKLISGGIDKCSVELKVNSSIHSVAKDWMYDERYG